MKTISTKFEAIKNISYVIGAIDGIHTPIIAVEKNAHEYYCRLEFYLVFLQIIVDAQYKF